MALKQHKDARVRYEQQVENSRAYVMPFIQKTKQLGPGTAILEIGCGEGGVLQPLIQAGCQCVGVDLDPPRIELAKEYLKDEIAAGKVEFLLQNIYDDAFFKRFNGHFDLIILKDVIEHVPEQEKFIPYIKKLLRPGGQIFFGFPPWYMPFGGHQQIAETKLASKLPYYHILPNPLYKAMLKAFGETQGKIDELLEVKSTRISIERFEKVVKQSGLKVMHKQHFLFNPIYKYKFGIEARNQYKIISALPGIRNFLTTCVYYTVG